MSNPYYTYSGAFLPGILARAEAETAEFQAVQAGFAILAIQGTDSGVANAYVVTTQGGKDSVYADGMLVEFKVLHANTASCTIAVDGGSTVGLIQPNGQSLAAGALVANTWYRCIYNSTYSAFTVVAPTPATTITSNVISASPPTNKVGLTAAGGVSTACIPIDITFAIDQGIVPTWTGAHTFSAAVTFSSTVTFSGGLSLTGNANQYAATLTGNSTSGQSLGLRVNAGTNASDFALRVSSQSAASDYFKVLGEGSVVIGSATGGGQGVGTINAVNLYINGVAVSTVVGANPGTNIGLSVVNGTATTFMRSDGAPALSQAIVPTWTGNHIFNGTGTPVTVNASANQIGVTVNGGTNTTNTYLAQFITAQASGFSSGVLIKAGTTSLDTALSVQSAAGTALTSILGNGAATIAAAAGAIVLQLKPGDSASVGLSILDPGANATQFRLNTNNTTCRIQSAGGAANMDFETNSAVQFRVSSTGQLTGNGPVNGMTDMTPDQGTFTLTSTGGPNLACVWARISNLVMLFIPTGTVSTGVTSWTATGLPSAIQPTRTQLLPFGPSVVEDNNVSLPGGIRVNAASGTVTFMLNNGNTWTTAWSNGGGVRGMLQVATVAYLLN